MENIIITPFAENYVRLKAADGYRLFSSRLNRFVSDAVVKENETNQFSAVAV